MNKPAGPELSECVFALIKFPLLCSGFPVRPYSRDSNPHQYLKCFLIKLRLLPSKFETSGWVEIKGVSRRPLLPPSHWLDVNMETIATTNCRPTRTSAGSGVSVNCGWACGGKRKHCSSNGGLNIYCPLDPAVQCACVDGWMMYAG